jgi:hypothetical protein
MCGKSAEAVEPDLFVDEAVSATSASGRSALAARAEARSLRARA